MSTEMLDARARTSAEIKEARSAERASSFLDAVVRAWSDRSRLSRSFALRQAQGDIGSGGGAGCARGLSPWPDCLRLLVDEVGVFAFGVFVVGGPGGDAIVPWRRFAFREGDFGFDAGFVQGHQRLDVAGLREHVERLHDA